MFSAVPQERAINLKVENTTPSVDHGFMGVSRSLVLAVGIIAVGSDCSSHSDSGAGTASGDVGAPYAESGSQGTGSGSGSVSASGAISPDGATHGTNEPDSGQGS